MERAASGLGNLWDCFAVSHFHILKSRLSHARKHQLPPDLRGGGCYLEMQARGSSPPGVLTQKEAYTERQPEEACVREPRPRAKMTLERKSSGTAEPKGSFQLKEVGPTEAPSIVCYSSPWLTAEARTSDGRSLQGLSLPGRRGRPKVASVHSTQAPTPSRAVQVHCTTPTSFLLLIV